MGTSRRIPLMIVLVCYICPPISSGVVGAGSASTQTAITIHKAAEAADFETVKVLIAAGAKIDSVATFDDRGDTVLHIVTSHPQVHVTTSMSLNDSTGIGRFTKDVLVLSSHITFIRWLLDHGANVNARNNFGETPLHLSAENGTLDVAELLIKRGARVDAEDILGKTPLDIAKRTGPIEVVGRGKVNEQMIKLLTNASRPTKKK